MTGDSGVIHAQHWPLDFIIVELKSLLSFFPFWLVSHICRELNCVAHSVAEWATACNFIVTIPISLISTEILVDRAERDASFVLRTPVLL